MLESPLRHAAIVLLESAIRIAPSEAREWGQAMRGELTFVEGRWAALMWAFGGASVMVKHALAALLIPGRGQGIPPGDELFTRSVSLGKAALVSGAGCVFAALLFLGAPPFRQAFQVSMKPWSSMFQSANSDRGFRALAKRAESRRDAEGLVFCAVRSWDAPESARLAREAVLLDAKLTWVYAVVAMRHPELPQVMDWMAELERSDPQNAVIHLAQADSIAAPFVRSFNWKPMSPEAKQHWQSRMAAAFRSTRFDDYFERVSELNRKVVVRYEFYDPYEVESREQVCLPVGAYENTQLYAHSLLQAGEELEARGDRKGALESYWTVARFGQIIDSQGHSSMAHTIGSILQAMAYKRLQASSEKEGNQPEAALFGYLATKFEYVSEESIEFPKDYAFGSNIARRNAAVVQISGLMILLLSGLSVVAVTILIAASLRRPGSVGAENARPVATLIFSSSAVGLFFSCVTLYLTYRPYWYIFQGAVVSGGRSQARDLLLFLNDTKVPAGVSPRVSLLLHSLLYSGSPNFLFYVWTGVTLLGLIGLALILLRHLLSRPRVNRLQNHPRVP